jgi:hypothetical protein
VTKKEAEQMLREQQTKATDKFCPIISRTCVQNCICYYEGRITKCNDDHDKWRIVSPDCGHVLISGELSVGL